MNRPRRGGPARVALAVALAAAIPGARVHADPGLHQDAAPGTPVPRAQVFHPRAPFRPVPVRAEDHAGFGRLTLGFAHAVPFTTSQDGNRVVLQFGGRVPIAPARTLPRNVTAVTPGPDSLALTLAPGAALRTSSRGPMLVLDVLDPPPVAATPPPSGTAAVAPVAAETLPAAVAAPAAQATPTPTPTPSAPTAAASAAAPVQPPPEQAAPAQAAAPSAPPAQAGAEAAPATGPVALAITRAALPAGTEGAAITVPFETGVGLALFRRGETALAVFDQTRPLDAAAVREDPVFQGLAVEVLPAATVLRFRLPAGTELRAARQPAGWQISVGPAMATKLSLIATAVKDGTLTLAAATPGRVVVVPDGGTGDNLLVGTQLAEGQGVLVGRREAEFALLPTVQGVVVDPLSDRLDLHQIPAGFVLSAGAGTPLALSPEGTAGAALENAATLTRRFDFPDLPIDRLTQRMQSAIAAAAAHPRLDRLAARRDAAQAMIALGLGAEAQALLQLAVADDPRAATDPDITGLSAIAAMLAGRTGDAGGIDAAGLGSSDEIRFWRAIHTALVQESAPEAATQLAATLPLLLAYPAPMRDRLLPLAAETLVLGGQIDAGAALLAQRKDDPSLALARAMLLEVQGKTPEALAAYDSIALTPDRLRSTRAAQRAIELRLAGGALTPGEAADAEAKLLYAWRGDDRERALRLRIAALRADAGQWRESLALLRDSNTLFGPQDKRFATALQGEVNRLLQDKVADQLGPLALVELIADNADLLPDGPAGEAMAARLADRLDRLDLPGRADPVLERLARTATAPAARGEFGARLAALRLRGGNAAGALDALAASGGDGFSQLLSDRRTLLQAKATAISGKPADALALLATLSGPDVDPVRAAILEQTRDFPGAEAVLQRYVAATTAGDAKLTPEQMQAVLRLASDAAQASDEAGLASLRAAFDARIADQSGAELFRSLTAAPVRGLADLPRSRREVTADKSLPQVLQAVTTRR